MLVDVRSPVATVATRYTVQILTFSAAIHGPETVIDAIREAFPPSPAEAFSPPPPTDWLDIQHGGVDGAWRVTINEVSLQPFEHLADLLTYLVWWINSEAISRLGSHHLLFHAAAVAFGQSGVVLAANSGSGKSTLTAGLVAAGATYFSDEVAVIEPGSGLLLPFPKAIKLEPDTLPVLASRYPTLSNRGRSQHRATFLRPAAERWASKPVSPTLVIFPCYRTGEPTRLSRVSRSLALERLLDQSFSTGGDSMNGIQLVVSLVQRCACFELTFSKLDDAVAQIAHIAA